VDIANDLSVFPDSAINQLSIVPVSRMEQVLEIALLRKPEAIQWDEPEVVQPAVQPAIQPDLGVTAH
jgi:ATP-dependent Lon protease